MRWSSLAAVLLLLAIAPATAAACHQEGELTIAKSRLALAVGKRERPTAAFTDVFACLRSTGRRLAVEPDTFVPRLKLRGAFFAYELFDQLGEELTWELVVADLRREDPRQPGTAVGEVADVADVTPDYPQGAEGPFLGRFALRPTGSVVFTVWHRGRWQVSRWSRGRHEPVVLDRRRGIDPSYLKLRGDTARWRRFGVLHTARIR